MYLDFYTRRVKRIFPALLLVLFFTLYTVATLSQKDQLKLTLGTLKASTLFRANIEVLTYKKGYFDAELRANPLLHLWSLGVEEQFYIIWPWLLTLALKLCKKWTLYILLMYAVISFFIQIMNTDSNPKFAFYFPFCRFWQMAIGGILAYLNLKIASSKISNLLAAIAMIGISFTVFILNESSKFPGYWALIPTLSSAFIIQAGENSLINKYILSSKPFVSIGKISYSLYLWHWPFLILCHTYFPYGSKSLWANSGFILLVVVAASVMTYFVAEKPLRTMKGKKVAIVLLVLMGGVLLSCFWVEANILNKLDLNENEIVKLAKSAEEQIKPRDPEDCYIKNDQKHFNPSISKDRQKPTLDKLLFYTVVQQGYILDKKIDSNSTYWIEQISTVFRHYLVSNQGQDNMVLLIGDSHTTKITHRFQHLYKDSLLRFISFPTIVTLVRFGLLDLNTQGDETARRLIVDFANKYRPKRILITKHWLKNWCEDLDKPFEDPANCNMEKLETQSNMITNFIKELQNLGCQVIVTEVAIQLWSLNLNTMKDANGELVEQNMKPYRLSDFKRKYPTVIDKFHDTIQPLNVQIITLTDNHCWEGICERFTPSGYPIHEDVNHYSKFFVKHWMSTIDHLVEF